MLPEFSFPTVMYGIEIFLCALVRPLASTIFRCPWVSRLVLNVRFQEPQLLIRCSRDLREQIRSGLVVVLVCDVNRLSDIGGEYSVVVDQGFEVSLPFSGFNGILGQGR